MKSDGNGGYVIQKGTFAAISLLIMLVSVISTVVAYSVTIKTDVDHLKEVYDEVHTGCEFNTDENSERINENQDLIIRNQEQILNMYDDIKEIKEDVKGLIRK